MRDSGAFQDNVQLFCEKTDTVPSEEAMAIFVSALAHPKLYILFIGSQWRAVTNTLFLIMIYKAIE